MKFQRNNRVAIFNLMMLQNYVINNSSVGDDPDSTYLVLSGRLRSIVLDEKGATRILGEYGRDDWVGLVSIYYWNQLIFNFSFFGKYHTSNILY